jgi:diguanylate cyclase (GGDEF)-like protein
MRLTRATPGRLTRPNPSPLATIRRTVLIAALLAAIFALDRATDAAPVQHLYYLPIVLAGLWFTRAASLSAAAAAVLLYHFANAHLRSLGYGEADVVQIVVFFAVAIVTTRLTADARRLHALAMTDDLTGLHNLRSFEAELAALMGAAGATGSPISLLVADVDRLKSLNDRHGHLAGAEAVRTVGQIIGVSVPADAIACRYGGDEFVIALPACDEQRATEVAERLRRTVQAAAPVLAGIRFPVGTLSISVGVACRTEPDGSPFDEHSTPGERLFRAADAALYAAKQGGRNGVSVRTTTPGRRDSGTDRNGPPAPPSAAPHSFSAMPNRSAMR